MAWKLKTIWKTLVDLPSWIRTSLASIDALDDTDDDDADSYQPSDPSDRIVRAQRLLPSVVREGTDRRSRAVLMALLEASIFACRPEASDTEILQAFYEAVCAVRVVNPDQKTCPGYSIRCECSEDDRRFRGEGAYQSSAERAQHVTSMHHFIQGECFVCRRWHFYAYGETRADLNAKIEGMLGPDDPHMSEEVWPPEGSPRAEVLRLEEENLRLGSENKGLQERRDEALDLLRGEIADGKLLLTLEQWRQWHAKEGT